MSLRETLERYIAARQFDPGLIGLWVNPFYHARRALHDAMQALAPELSGRILDVGCGRMPYRHLFTGAEYVGLEIDTPQNRARNKADHYYDGSTLPFEAASFDHVLANQVLEHVFDPDRLLAEIHRVLRPGGFFVLTVPFVWDEHEQPVDYARYSSFGLRHLLDKHGFQVVRHEKLNADTRVLFQLVNAYLRKTLWTRRPFVNLAITAIAMSPANILGALLHRLLPANADLYLDQLALARKPPAVATDASR